jgi:hypothetical protein
MTMTVSVPHIRVVIRFSAAAPWARGASAPSAKMIGTSATSSNSSMPSAARPTWLVRLTSGSTSAVEDKASAKPSAIAGVQP